MKLTDKAIAQIDNKRTRTMLALELDVTEKWIDISIKKNTDNGLLTTVAAINVIRKETGMKQNEILEEKTELAKVG